MEIGEQSSQCKASVAQRKHMAVWYSDRYFEGSEGNTGLMQRIRSVAEKPPKHFGIITRGFAIPSDYPQTRGKELQAEIEVLPSQSFH